MNFETLRYEVEDQILTLTLNRPEQLNAFNGPMMNELIAAFDAADADDAVRAIIVTGAGRAFCAGADLSQGAKTFDYAKRDDKPEKADTPRDADGNPVWSHESVRDGGGRVTLRIYECLKPVIAAINGPAVGIGATMTLAMDLRLASTKARIGFVFGRLGIVPEAASTWFLPRIVGIQQALEWVYSADVLDAQAAYDGRLVRSLHEPKDLLPAAQELARSFVVDRSPVALGLAKRLLYRNSAAAEPLEAHLSDSLAMFWTSVGDGKEGVAAFREKRAPRFTGRASGLPQVFPG